MEEYYFLLVKKGAQMAGMDKAQESTQGLLVGRCGGALTSPQASAWTGSIWLTGETSLPCTDHPSYHAFLADVSCSEHPRAWLRPAWAWLPRAMGFPGTECLQQGTD